jgi:GT2 family glycosyltransferase
MNDAPITCRVAVVVASTGRPRDLGQLIAHLSRQTLAPAKIVLSVVADRDLPEPLPDGVQVVMGGKGLPAQRNRGLETVFDVADVVAFFDDDYVPSIRAVEGIAKLFDAYPDLIGANGRLLADGINTAGISYEEAAALVEEFDRAPAPPPQIERQIGALYGCQMAYRLSAIREVRFDEQLPLYGWLEDLDFGVRLKGRGRMVRCDAFVGVHRGAKGGRTSGVRLGYSQVVNPIYLTRKGTLKGWYGRRHIWRHFLANHVKAISPEPWVDRAGRAKGNWLGLWELATGRAHPMRILEID